MLNIGSGDLFDPIAFLIKKLISKFGQEIYKTFLLNTNFGVGIERMDIFIFFSCNPNIGNYSNCLP